MRDQVAMGSVQNSRYVRVRGVRRRAVLVTVASVIVCSTLVGWMARQDIWRGTILNISSQAAMFIQDVNEDFRSSTWSGRPRRGR